MQTFPEAMKAAITALAAWSGYPAVPPTPPADSPVAVVPRLVIPDTLVAGTDRVARVTVTLSQPARRPLAWECLPANGSAYAPAYFAVPKQKMRVDFMPGETRKVVEIPLLRDLGDKDFTLQCMWTLNHPPVAGGQGVIRGGGASVAVRSAAPRQPAYPPVARTQGRKLVFSSTFSEPITANAVKGAWRSRPHWGDLQAGNKEIAPYVDPATQPGVDPHPVVAGKRVLRAQKVRARSLMTGQTYDYAASMLDGINLYSYRYGYAELRAKWGRAQGTSTAWWLLPATGGWPPEIDVFETGLGDRPDFSSGQVQKIGGQRVAETYRVPVAVEDGRWHVIGFDWTPQWQVTFIDGVEVSRRPNLVNEPMFFVLNVAVGGLGPPPANAGPGWKSELTLDYLKVWQ